MKVLSSRVLELELRVNRKAGQSSQGDLRCGKEKKCGVLDRSTQSAFHNISSNLLFYFISLYFISFIHSLGQWEKHKQIM